MRFGGDVAARCFVLFRVVSGRLVLFRARVPRRGGRQPAARAEAVPAERGRRDGEAAAAQLPEAAAAGLTRAKPPLAVPSKLQTTPTTNLPLTPKSAIPPPPVPCQTGVAFERGCGGPYRQPRHCPARPPRVTRRCVWAVRAKLPGEGQEGTPTQWGRCSRHSWLPRATRSQSEVSGTAVENPFVD